MEELENQEEYTLEGVRETILVINSNFPPETRTPEINELLEQLKKIEAELNSKNKPVTV